MRISFFPSSTHHIVPLEAEKHKQDGIDPAAFSTTGIFVSKMLLQQQDKLQLIPKTPD